MSEHALRQLEAVRAETVAQAQRALREAQRGCDEAASVQQQAQRVLAEHEREVLKQREVFAQASDVLTLRACEAKLSAVQRAVSVGRERLARAEQRCREARALVVQQQTALRHAEVARRAVARTLEQRAVAVALRTERSEEDALDEQLRARGTAKKPRGLADG